MADRSLLSKFTHALLGDEEKSAADIDREVESAVRAIKKNKGDALDGADILLENWGRPGDLVYVMDLVPIYDAVGGADGALGRRLGEVCANIFSHHVRDDYGHGAAQGELFVMRFADPTPEAGFRKAAEIVNDIGTQMMGERFKTIAIPDLVVVADVADISDGEGCFNIEKAKAAVKRGGIELVMDEPAPDDAEWLHERWRKVRPPAEHTDQEWSELHRRKRGDSDWVNHRNDRRRIKLLDASRSERRSGTPRRATDHATEMDW